MCIVQFYAALAQKYVTISKHKSLAVAIKKARKSYVDDGYFNVSILNPLDERLDIYGKQIDTKE